MVNNVYIHTIPLALALLLGQHAFAQDVSYVLAAKITSATNTLMAIPCCLSDMAQYNGGYSASFLGVYPIANHTKTFWTGYRSGVEDFQWDKGYAEGYNNLAMSGHTPDYVTGYQDGQYDLKHPLPKNGEQYTQLKLPAQTDDNYYIGFNDGKLAGSTLNTSYSIINGHQQGSTPYHGCPVGKHTHEYRLGFKNGFNYGTWDIVSSSSD